MRSRELDDKQTKREVLGSKRHSITQWYVTSNERWYAKRTNHKRD